MQQRTKRWISLLLAAVLCISAGGVPALAADAAEADSGISTLPAADGPAVSIGEPSDSQPAEGSGDTDNGGTAEPGGDTNTNGSTDTGEEGGDGSQEPSEPAEPGNGDSSGSENGGDNSTVTPGEGENGAAENGGTENGTANAAPADEENKPAVKTEDIVPDGFFTNITIGKDYKDGKIEPFEDDIKTDANCAVLFNYTVPVDMTVGTKYTFTVKAPLIADAKFTIQAHDDEGNLITVADGALAKQSAGVCDGWLKFRDGMDAYCKTGVEGYFYVGAKFDKEEIGTGGRKELNIEATGGFTLKEELDFEIPQITAGVNLNKDCHGYAYMADHKIQWILKATPWINNADEINSLVITDPIPDTMTYDASNAEPKAVLKDGKTEAEGTFTYDEETRTLKFEGSGNSLKKESWPITITFFANYDVNNLPTLNNKGEAKFTNTAHAEITAPQFEKNEDGTIEKVDGKITPDNTKDAKADAEKSSWITCMYLDKAGSLRNGNTVHWTITATNGMSQKNPKLVDKLPAHMVLKSGSSVTLKIGDTTKTPTEGSDYTLSYDDAAHQYTMTILLDTTTTKAQIVEYDTMFDGDSGEAVKKIAEVINNVDFVVGEPGHEQTIHKQGKVHIGNVLMTKTGQYDAKTHRIKWTVVLRTDGQALENIVVTDTFAQKIGSVNVAQTYVPGSMYLNGNISLDPSDSSNYDLEVAEDRKSFTLKVAKQHSNNDILTYETELEDSENGHGFWGTNYTKNNGKFKIYNYLTMDADGLPDQAEVKISGATDGWSNVLQKSAGDYDAANHEITWKIKVNQNQMKLTNGIIKDVLTDNNWVFVQDSVTAKVGSKEVALTPTFDKTAEGENGLPRMTISLPDMAEGEGPMEITYRTKLVSNDPLLSNTTFNAKNVATLTGDQIPTGGVTVSADKKVGQTVLSKKLENTKLNEKNELVWTVDVNRNLADITAPGNIGIEDVLQQGLVYVAGTLKVNRLTINKNGSDTVGTALTEGKDYTVEYDSAARKLTLTWLKNSLKNEAYRVTFNTRVLVSGSYSNTVRFTGFGEDGKNNSSVNDRLITFGGGWTSIPKGMGNLEIVKLDGTSNKPLAGVEFGLYEQKKDGTEDFYGSFKTDKDGKITAQLPFGTWIVHELTPLNGYALPSVNEWTYTINSSKTYSQTVKNYKP